MSLLTLRIVLNFKVLLQFIKVLEDLLPLALEFDGLGIQFSVRFVIVQAMCVSSFDQTIGNERNFAAFFFHPVEVEFCIWIEAVTRITKDTHHFYFLSSIIDRLDFFLGQLFLGLLTSIVHGVHDLAKLMSGNAQAMAASSVVERPYMSSIGINHFTIAVVSAIIKLTFNHRMIYCFFNTHVRLSTIHESAETHLSIMLYKIETMLPAFVKLSSTRGTFPDIKASSNKI